MTDPQGPEALRSLAAGLHSPITSDERDQLSAHANVWEAERLNCVALVDQLGAERTVNEKLKEQLTAAQKRLEVLEQDRKWWQDNAIRRVKRSATRRSERPPRKRGSK